MRPIALRMVYQVASAVDIPIIGCGGITTGEDAVEMMMAGADAIQVGTATFLNPGAPLVVLDGIETYARENGVETPREIIGAALPGGHAAEAGNAGRTPAQRVHP